jgi:hypothetical protein
MIKQILCVDLIRECVYDGTHIVCVCFTNYLLDCMLPKVRLLFEGLLQHVATMKNC